METYSEDSDAVTGSLQPVVPKLDIASAVPFIQDFAETPEMNALIVAGNEHSVTFRSEASTLREMPLLGKLPSAKYNGSPEKVKLILTPRSKIKLSDAFRNYQKSNFPSARAPPAKSGNVTTATIEHPKNPILHEVASSEFRKLNAALSKEGRRRFQSSKMNPSNSIVSISERAGFTTDYRDLSLNTKRYLEALDHMKSRDAMRSVDDKRRLAISQNEKHKSAVSGEDVEKFFHKATSLACASDSVYVRRDAAQAVATLMVSSLPSDVLMSQPESLSGMLDLFQSEKIDASVKLKVLNSFASIVEDDRYKVLTLQQRALFQRFISLDHKKSKSFANGKAQVLSAMTFTSDCSLKDEFQIQGGFNEICRMIEDARDVRTIENLIPGIESLLCDPHDSKTLHWSPSCIEDIVKISACDFPRIRIAALNGITNCCRSIHLQVQHQMSTIRNSCSQYKLLLTDLDPIDFRTMSPESIGEYMFRLKALKSLLSASSEPLATMGEILPILLKFIRTSPECLQHENTLAATKAITSEIMFRDNLSIRVAFARLIRPGPLVECPKKFKGTSNFLDKVGGSATRRVTGLDSDLSPRVKKSFAVSDNLTPRASDAAPSILNNSKAEEILESENIAANILAQAIEILAHIFKQGTGTKFFSLFSFLFVFIQTCQMNCEAPSQILTINLVIAWKQLPFILHYPEFTKKRELCFAISADTLVSYRTFHCDTELPKRSSYRNPVSDASSKSTSPFTEPRYLQTLCALLAANDMSLCERILHFLLFDAVQIRMLPMEIVIYALLNIVMTQFLQVPQGR